MTEAERKGDSHEARKGDNHEAHRTDMDRGWAWIVLMSSCLGMVLRSLTLYMNGVLYIAFLDKYHGDSKAKTALPGAICSGLYCFTAPLGGILNNKFSCRFTIICGGCLASLGYVSSAFVPDLNWMIFTAGVCVGTGHGLTTSGVICVLGFNFEKWRNQAIAFNYICAGGAILASAPFGLYLLDTFGLAMTLTIMGSIEAHICVLGMLCRPSSLETHVLRQKKIYVKQSSSLGLGLKSFIDFSLLLRKEYTFYLFSTTSWNFALAVAIIHLPNYVATIGGTISEIALVMEAFSIASLTGRFAVLAIVSKLREYCLQAHLCILALMGIITMLFPYYSNMPGGTYIFATQLGLFTGGATSLMTPLSLSFVGVEKMSEAHGMGYFFCGIGMAIGPVTIGYFYDLTGSYGNSFIVAGILSAIGCVCGIGSLCCRRKMDTGLDMEIFADDVNNDKIDQEKVSICDNPLLTENRALPLNNHTAGVDIGLVDMEFHTEDTNTDTVDDEKGSSCDKPLLTESRAFTINSDTVYEETDLVDKPLLAEKRALPIYTDTVDEENSSSCDKPLLTITN